MTGIKIEYEVTDGGSTNKATSATGLLKKGLDDVTAAANKAGSAVKASMQPGGTKTSAAINKASSSTSDLLDYNRAKGIGGATGAAGRDFAKQAEGLGGLVRVYATFAANLFAVSAAFTALREAASTENLIKGLDQLGAASGKSLGTLSKQIAETTGGALSLRDAMTAVAQASSAGLGNKQIQELAVVAAKASNALGIGMSDAISRLSRGISKIEPELLDEIGIFVRVDDAVSKYALSVGKTTTSLSDFERRQAFANAVLEQGKEKFAAIESAPNPYDKLLASITNLATAGLELVNKVLAPIVSVLAESPTALAALFVTIATVLLKQAIPAIGQFREGMRKSAEDALKSAEAFKESFGDRFQGRLEQRFKLPDLQAEVKKFEDRLANIKLPKQLSTGSVGRLLTSVEQDPKAVASAEKTLARLNSQIETGIKGTKEMSEAQKAAAVQERDNVQAIIALYKKRLELTKATNEAQGVADKDVGALDPEKIAQRRYENLRKKASSMAAVSAAAETAQVTGVRDAWRELSATVEKENITGITKYTTLAKGGLTAVASRVMGIAAAFGPLAEAAAIAIGVISGIDSVLSQATKEQEEYTNKVESTKEAIKTVNNTFDLYVTKRKDAFSIAGIVAFNTALAGTSDAFKDQLEALEKYRKASGVWDVLKDTVSSMWGGSNLQKAKKSAQESVTAVLKSLEFSSGKGKAIVDIAGAIGIDPSKINDTKALKEAISDLNESDLSKLSEEFKRVEEREQFTTNAAKAFIESLTAIDKLVDQMIQANAFTDLQGKLGVELVSAAQKFAQALEDPLKALLDIEALAKDPKALAVLGNVNLKQIFDATKAVKDLNEAELDLAKATEEKAKQTANSNVSLADAMDSGGLGAQIQAQAQEIADANYNEATIKLGLLKKQASEFAQAQANLIETITNEGFKRVMLGLKLAEEQAGITVARAKMSVAASAGLDTSSREFELRTQEINIQKRLVDASYEAQMATMKNTEEISKLTATQQILAAEALKAKGGTADEVKANAKLAESMTKSAQKTLNMFMAKDLLKSPVRPAEMDQEFDAATIKLAKSSIQADKIPAMQRSAAQAKLNADQEVARIEKITKERDYQLKLSLDKIAVDKEAKTIESDILNTASQLNSYSSESLILAKAAIQDKLQEADISGKRKQLEEQLVKIEREKKSATDQSYLDQKKLTEDKLANLTADEQAKKLALQLNTIKEKGAAKQADITFKTGIEVQNLQTANSVIETRINLEQKRLDILAQSGMFDEQTIIRLKAEAELQLQSLKYTEQAARLAVDVQQKQAALNSAKESQTAAQNAAKAAPGNTALGQAVNQATTAVTNAQAALDAATAQQDAAKKINDLTTTSISKQEELNQKFAQQKQYLTDIANLGTALGAVFGETGTKLGGVISGFEEFGTKQLNSIAGIKELGNQAKDAYKKASEADDSEEREKYIKQGSKALTDQSRLQEKSDREAVAGSAKLLGATKNLFKEKTVAYKLFATLEKATQLASLAMELKVSAAKIGAWITEVTVKGMTEAQKTAFESAGFFARLPMYVSSIYGSTIGQLGPIAGPVVAAGLVAAFLGQFTGRKAAPGGFSAGEQQKVQGTGLKYDEAGKVVQRSGGVTGDVTALADSVSSSIDGLSKEFFSLFGSNSSSNIVKALTKIEDNTGDMVKAFLGKLVGFGSGSQFGTVESSSKVLGGLWGKSSTTIADVGVQVNGLLENLGKGIGAFQQYENIIQKSSSWFGLSSSTNYYTNIADIPKAAKQALQDIFGNVGTVLTESAIALEGNASRVNNMLNQIPIDFKVSLKGLTGEEAAKAIMAEVSVQLNAAAEKVFPYLAKYNRIGEEMYETVSRIVKEGEVLTQGLTMIGKSISGFTAEVTVAMQQDLIEKSGGIEKFSTSIQYYFDNFISAQKRYEVSFSALNQKFKDAGMTLPKTKQAYMALVEQADTTTETGRAQLATLLTLAEQYDTLLEAQAESYKDQIETLTETISKFRDFAKTLNDFKNSLVLSASSTATPLEKYAEAKTQFESTYALALSGDKDAMGKLTGISQTFLDLSKQVYASSDAYTKDFNTVLDKINTASISASASADVAQLQLDAINTQISLLSSINTNIATIAGVPAKAGGGRVSGLTLVGEMGPELVDFTTPGRAYTADQTAGMFGPSNGIGPAIGAMVAEIQQLREEVCALRKDQQKQTGDLIISNYDANQKAAEEVATAVVTASADSTWTERSKSEIK